MEKNLVKSKDQLRPYEAVILMHPDASVEDQKEFFKKNKGIISDFKGSVHSLETWGKRSLANPIGKAKKAYFFHTMFEAQPAVVAELERTMRINDKVLRFTHTKLDERVSLVKHLENFKKVCRKRQLVKKSAKLSFRRVVLLPPLQLRSLDINEFI